VPESLPDFRRRAGHVTCSGHRWRPAIYELADGETAIVAGEPFAPLRADLAWQTSAPELAIIAERESKQLARARTRLHDRAAPTCRDRVA